MYIHCVCIFIKDDTHGFYLTENETTKYCSVTLEIKIIREINGEREIAVHREPNGTYTARRNKMRLCPEKP